jgi:hypothetical protein
MLWFYKSIAPGAFGLMLCLYKSIAPGAFGLMLKF